MQHDIPAERVLHASNIPMPRVQWFGDLVTEVWWNNLWLAESLATYWEVSHGYVIYVSNISGGDSRLCDLCVASSCSQGALSGCLRCH